MFLEVRVAYGLDDNLIRATHDPSGSDKYPRKTFWINEASSPYTCFICIFSGTDVVDAQWLPVNESGTLVDKGIIMVNTDFPHLADVQVGWFYRIGADVTDNAGVPYTNTGQSAIEGEEIYWNGTNWTFAGENRLLEKVGGVLRPINEVELRQRFTEVGVGRYIDGVTNLINTDYTLATASAGTTLMDNKVIISNGANKVKIRVAYIPSGDALSSKNYLIYDFELDPYLTFWIDFPVFLEGDSVVVRSDAVGVNFYFNGNSYSAVISAQTQVTRLSTTGVTNVFVPTAARKVAMVWLMNDSANDVSITVWRSAAGSESSQYIIYSGVVPAGLGYAISDIEQIDFFASGNICAAAGSADKLSVLVFAK